MRRLQTEEFYQEQIGFITGHIYSNIQAILHRQECIDDGLAIGNCMRRLIEEIDALKSEVRSLERERSMFYRELTRLKERKSRNPFDEKYFRCRHIGWDFKRPLF